MYKEGKESKYYIDICEGYDVAYRRSAEVVAVVTVITDVWIDASSEIETIDDMRRLFRRAICIDDINRCAKRMSVDTYIKIRLTFSLRNAGLQLNIANIKNRRGEASTAIEYMVGFLNGEQQDVPKSASVIMWEEKVEHNRLLLLEFENGCSGDPLLVLVIDNMRDFYRKLRRERDGKSD